MCIPKYIYIYIYKCIYYVYKNIIYNYSYPCSIIFYTNIYINIYTYTDVVHVCVMNKLVQCQQKVSINGLKVSLVP